MADHLRSLGLVQVLVANDRALAREGIDPRHAASSMAAKPTYAAVVDDFIKLYAKPRQRTWDQTRRILLVNCAPWLNKPITDIGKKDAYNLLDGFIAAGHGPKAAVTLAWIKKLWRWAWERDLVVAPIMDAVKIDFERRVRDRCYSDEEIKAIWRAANGLDPIAGAYIKLLILLAPRKTALARMRLSDLDNADNPTLWTTPFDLTKSKKTSGKKREYLTPLPKLASRIIKGLQGDDYLFPTLPILYTKADRPILDGKRLIQKLVAHGAPKDFGFHVMRHTIASWLETAGHDEWERGLVLNHSGSGVTAGYSHGHPIELKRELLTKWADHVEQLVQPAEGVQVLR
jgi:integrase